METVEMKALNLTEVISDNSRDSIVKHMTEAASRLSLKLLKFDNLRRVGDVQTVVNNGTPCLLIQTVEYEGEVPDLTGQDGSDVDDDQAANG